jgi:hypothetical protein
MKKIIAYLIICLALSIFTSISQDIIKLPDWLFKYMLAIKCTFTGVVGGVLYCLRAVYLNKCVRKKWDKDWEVWYYLRPIASGISGFISYIFLKAGLIVLEANVKTDAVTFGYLAIAFIAGYNVDNFMKKLESIASSVWGIKKSRASSDIEDNNKHLPEE